MSSSVASNDSAEMADVFIKADNTAAARNAVEERGGMIHTIGENILTASISIDSVEDLANSGDIQFIEGTKPIGFTNDVALSELNVYEVHDGMNLPEGYTGSGVVVGIIDTGIDYTHPDFYDADGNSRILSIWNQTRSGGPAPDVIENSSGTECDADSIVNGECPLTDNDGHGTHVAGTAAGRNETYGGVAPDANIIVVSYDSSVNLQSGYAEPIFSTKICQAAYYIFSKAESLGMPAVINLSLGTHIGAHDGTSLFEQCLSELVKDSAGRAIVAAAGNEYSTDNLYTGIHAGGNVDGTVASNFVIRKLTSDRIYYIDLWGAQGSDLSVGLAIHDGDPSGTALKYSGLVAAGQEGSGSFLDGGVEYSINFTESESALNGKPHAGIRISVSSSVGDMSNYSFDVVVSGSGSFDAWLFPDKPSKTVQFTSTSGDSSSGWTHIPGDSLNSIAIPATSPDIIAVGGYTTRNKWDQGPGCCEVEFELNTLLDFSSSGPTASPEWTGVKPDIAAPGGMIASAMSAQAQYSSLLVLSDGAHALQAGTSMAAPFVTGTIALMFSADRNYTFSDVKKYIIESAYVDEAVGSSPNDRWGHGKLDVLAAVETAVNGGASGHFDRNQSLNEPDGKGASSSGKSSCTLSTANAGMNKEMATLSMMVIALAFLALRKRAMKL